MLLSKVANVQWGYRNDKHYISKGYIHAPKGTRFDVKVSDLPINSRALVIAKCECCGAEKEIPYYKYRSKSNHEGRYFCQKCTYKSPSTRMSFEEVKKTFNNKGYILLSKEDEYKNSNQKLKYICPNHKDKGVLTTTVSLIKTGSGCKYCGRESQAKKNTKHSIEEAKEVFSKHDYVLLENTFKSVTTKMKCKCKKHKDIIQYKTLVSMFADKGCYYCDLEKRSERFSGEGSLTWRGGITPLRKYLRSHSSDWAKRSLEQYNSRCYITGSTENLVVHHVHSFENILDEVITKNNINLKELINEYTKEELKKITFLFKKENNKCLGVPLTEDMHKLFHREYGYGNNTKEQFKSFVNSCKRVKHPQYIQLALTI